MMILVGGEKSNRLHHFSGLPLFRMQLAHQRRRLVFASNGAAEIPGSGGLALQPIEQRHRRQQRPPDVCFIVMGKSVFQIRQGARISPLLQETTAQPGVYPQSPRGAGVPFRKRAQRPLTLVVFIVITAQT